MKYYLIAGEASGDLHGSNLMRELLLQDHAAEFRFWGGDRMQAVGGFMVRHYKDHDHMGIVEVIKHLPKILNNIKSCKRDIAEWKPDAVIFVDFPGFNLRIVPYVKQLGIKTFYYISPTVWAWKESRVKIFQKYVDRLFVELPFVKDFYEKRYGYEVDFVGHPLLDSIAQRPCSTTLDEFIHANHLPRKPIIALLPGSRPAEIRENLKTMQHVAQQFGDYEFVIGAMSRFSADFYRKYIHSPNVSLVFDQTYDLLHHAQAAVVVSGSATLETAIIGTPMIIVYQTSPVTFYIGKLFVKLNHLGLPNIIMDREIAPEFLQKDMTPRNISKSLDGLLHNSQIRGKILNDYALLRERLGNEGASRRTAELIWKYIRK